MRLLTGAAIALLASTATFAQPMMGGHDGDRPMMGMGGGPCSMMTHTEGALAFLRTELKIGAAQEKYWDAFAAAFRDEAAKREGHRPKHRGDPPRGGRGHGEDMTFADMAAHHMEMMDEHQAGFKRLYDAAKPLYDSLNGEQRKSADELLMHFLMSHHCGMM